MNKISFQERLIRAFGRKEDHEKYFDIFKDEFWKKFWKLRDDLDLDVYEDIKGAIRLNIETDVTKINPSTTADVIIEDGIAKVRFNPDTCDKSWSIEDHNNFKDKETYVRYLAYHECCHCIGVLLDSNKNEENAKHGKIFRDLMNRYRSEYTNVEFISVDGVHSNFSELVTYGYRSLAFVGKTGKQVAKECFDKFGDITTEEGWKRLKDYNDSL